MTTRPFTRRRMISLGLLACAGGALPLATFTGLSAPSWLTGLAARLGKHSLWVRTGHGAKGEVELHCGIRDVVAWAEAFSKVALKDTKVLAAGNVLSFSCDGRAVRVVMHQTSVS